jgi:polyphosphate kinase
MTFDPISSQTREYLQSPRLFINRELSWLEFNARVLHEALDERTPLLERLKFIAIFSSNLDEFYMVRVAGLRRQLAAGVTAQTPDDLTPQEQLEAIERRVRELLALQQQCLAGELLPRLAEHGIRLVGMEDLKPPEWAAVDAFYESHLFPVLTPLAVDPGHPFPYISNLSLSLAVEVRDPETGDVHFARVKVPRSLPRWVPIGRPNHFVPLEQVIGANLGSLFPGMEVLSWSLFRITRNSDFDISAEEEPDDLLEMIQEQVFLRRFGEVVRLEVDASMPQSTRALLLEELRDDRIPSIAALGEDDVHETRTLLECSDLMELAMLDVPALRDPPLVPATPVAFRDAERSVFAAIQERDILVHHPFESFGASVEHFLESAARDEDVLAIKLTLYRTSLDTPVVRALAEAAELGKQVVVLVELKARFDEANNITWARTLESAGVHVVYGLMALKTHTKTALVVRREPDGIRRYVHIGTGNYNSRTARLYTDLGLFTVSPSIGADVSDLFNFLTGFSRQRLYRKLIVAPGQMRERFIELVDREARHASEGRGGRIIAKMNALVDADAIRALYRASQAGVSIDLIIRGICCLRPGIDGLSENIRVISVVGRFLEHSRIFHFANAGEPEYFIGSADWMPRNFDRRVEAVVPVEDQTLHARLGSILQMYLRDNRQAWELSPEGSYTQRRPGAGEPERSSHVVALLDAWGGIESPPPPQVDREFAGEESLGA